MREEQARRAPRYKLRPTTTPPAPKGTAGAESKPAAGAESDDEFRRAEAEDDDGYDPYSDRPADAEPPWEADPWE